MLYNALGKGKLIFFLKKSVFSCFVYKHVLHLHQLNDLFVYLKLIQKDGGN